MCDYSLEHVESREAKVGDKLVTSIFPISITRGFTEVGKPGVAVCLLPGTELAFDKNVKTDHPFTDHPFGFYPVKDLDESTAIFRQRDPELHPHDHRDQLEFPSGRTALLTRLVVGQIATVLQLPAVEKPAGVDVGKLKDLLPAE